ncbi:hypothetical protein OHS33_39690 (plasmid) [Streptomyces sp. NBC_00536]|uniref:hypothetical protein n=1 Tax=Streptomyces sp. NBC_00536 TaxID=2975769 RepID=UPI002E803D87|nr:hypothetical protein [Streptomyces sp. NBC_00536]WUC84491.1 hypothetical protein OHS33_39690 [Streptomyces sp. NBC_00536]
MTTNAATETVLTRVLKAHGDTCACEGVCGGKHAGRRCGSRQLNRHGRTGLTAAPYPPHTTDMANAAAPLSELRPWCPPCLKGALEIQRDRVADQRHRELEESQLDLFDIDKGAAA